MSPWCRPARARRAGTATTIPGGATTTATVKPPLRTVGQVEQDRPYPSMTIAFLIQTKLREDRVDVPLDRPHGDEQTPGDGGVVRPGRHLGQHLALAGGEVAQAAAGAGQQPRLHFPYAEEAAGSVGAAVLPVAARTVHAAYHGVAQSEAAR